MGSAARWIEDERIGRGDPGSYPLERRLIDGIGRRDRVILSVEKALATILRDAEAACERSGGEYNGRCEAIIDRARDALGLIARGGEEQADAH